MTGDEGMRVAVQTMGMDRTKLLGVVAILVAGVAFAVMSNSIRHLAEMGYSSWQVIMLRNIFGLMWLLPWVWQRREELESRNRWGHAWRAVIACLSMSCWFYAVGHMPLPEAVALTYTAPLFLTPMAWFLLGEALKPARVVALVVGLTGVMMVIRPGFHTVGWGALLPLGSAFLQSVGVLLIKPLAKTETPFAMVWYMTLFMIPLSLPMGIMHWRMPGIAHVPWFMLVALASSTVQYMIARAYSWCEVTFLLPFDFMRLIVTSLIAFYWFGDTIDAWALAGAAVIITASIANARAESKTSLSKVPLTVGE